jgi:diguanylate cyclase (GGDEF)-like protein/PAS domain S-box-containing protein
MDLSSVRRRRPDTAAVIDAFSPLRLSPNRFRLLVAAAALIWSGTILFGVGTATTSQRVSDFGLIVAAFAAAYACLGAARRDRSHRRVWALLGASAFSWGCGQTAWTWYEAILSRDVPFPSVADIGYLCAVPFAVAALACLPSAPRTVAGRVRTVLDGLMIAGSLLLTSWVLVLNAVFRAGGDTFLKQAISLAYPGGDVVVVTIVFYVMLRIRQTGRQRVFPLGLIGVALLGLAFADSGFAYLTATNAYVSGSFIDVGWFLGYTLILLAAARPVPAAAEEEEPEDERDRSAGFLLPYAAIGMALVISSMELLRTGKAHSLTPWVRTFIIIALVVRQILTLRENKTLTERLEARLVDLRGSEQRFEGLVRHSSDVVTVIDPDGTIQYQSESIQRVFGHRAETLLGRSSADMLDIESARRLAAMVKDVIAEPYGVRELEVQVRDSSGALCNAEMTVTNLLDDPAVHGLVLNTRDVSEQKRLEDKLVHQAFHDSLTALANRELFRDRVDEILRRSGPGLAVAILVLDLDGFKQVNDLLGHASGDELLVEVAERLHASVRPNDTVARLGGDEFAVLLENADGPAAERVARRITTELQRPFQIDGQEVHIRGSVGIASAGRGLVEADKLLRNADLAMYRAKAAGEGGFRWYDPDLHVDLVERLQLVSDLRRAIETGELVLHYQPTVALSSGRIGGVEALVRWKHPTRGLLPPEQFVTLAEETGLIVPLGHWALGEACRQAAQWHAERPGRRLTMGVNISGRQLERPNFAEHVAEALEESGLPPELLVLEMTESVLLDDTGATLGRVKQLKELGVHLAIDDFGTGYSSLSYLHRFPVDVLKIDRSFIEHLQGKDDDRALVGTIVRLGQSLRMATVAEGVEDPTQVAALRAMGCDFAQGYHFSRPAPAELIDGLLAAEGDAPAVRKPRLRLQAESA